MANSNNPKGFTAVSHVTGGEFASFRTARIKSGYNTTIAKGDAVKLVATANDGTYIQRLAAGDKNGYGVFLGCSYIDSSTGYTKRTQLWTAGTTVSRGNIIANVLVDKGIIYRVQADGALDYDDINKNVDVLVADGDLLGSQMQIDSSTAVDGAAQFRFLGFYEDSENEPNSAYNQILVKFAESTDAQVDPTPA